MDTYQIEEYAKENGFDSVKFRCTNIFGKSFDGKFLDAYYGMVIIPEISADGFIRLDTIRKELGNNFLSFEVISNQ